MEFSFCTLISRLLEPLRILYEKRLFRLCRVARVRLPSLRFLVIHFQTLFALLVSLFFFLSLYDPVQRMQRMYTQQMPRNVWDFKQPIESPRISNMCVLCRNPRSPRPPLEFIANDRSYIHTLTEACSRLSLPRHIAGSHLILITHI